MACSYQRTKVTIGDFGSINGSSPVPCRCEDSFAIYGICRNAMCRDIWEATKETASKEAAEDLRLNAKTKAGRLARKNAAIAASQKKAKAAKKK